MVSGPVVCLNDEPVKNDKAGEIKESGRVPREVKSLEGQDGTFVGVRLTATGVSL